MVDEDAKKERQREYTSRDLGGLKVEHMTDAFTEGKSVILTLKDSGVLDEDAGDTLVNVNIADDERTKKRNDDLKKYKAGYNAYDNEEIDELTGEVKRKNMLDKYDEEIMGEQKDSFVLGKTGHFDEEEERIRERERVKARLKAKKVETLELPALKMASDYMTAEEATAKFKKTKKKKKVKRRALRADDLLPQEGDGMGSLGSRRNLQALKEEEENSTGGRGGGGFRGAMPMDIDEDDKQDVKEDIDLSNVKVEDEDDMGLEMALKKARRIKQKSHVIKKDVVDLVLAEPKIKREEEDVTGSEFIATFEEHQSSIGGGKIILNETAEFCRNLGARYADELALKKERVKEEVAQDLLEFEDSLKSSATKRTEAFAAASAKRKAERRRGGWAAVNNDASAAADDSDEEQNTFKEALAEAAAAGDDDDEPVAGSSSGTVSREAILGEEPNLQSGVAAAIRMAASKGYWETREDKTVKSSLTHLEAKNYSIDDKMMRGGDDDRGRMRDRFSGGGPTTSFEEKKGYVPKVNLEYIDDSGRLLNTKEAFRYLSHKFHGKGSGKIKTEKRMKKIQEESMMMNMSSTDTPLGTLDKLKKKQKDNALPYLVMSGSMAGQNLSDIRSSHPTFR